MVRKEAFTAAAQTSATVSELEQQYLTLSHGLTSEQGMALGLRTVTPLAYVHTLGATAFAQSPSSF